MKKITTIGCTILLLAGSSFARSTLILDKTFGLAEDEKIEVLAYMGEEKSAKIKTADGISLRAIDSFPEAAQKEIFAWAADKAFESSSGLRVRIKQAKERRSVDTKKGRRRTTGDVDLITYTAELENRSDVALKGVTVEAVIYYEQHHDKNEQKLKVSSSAKFDFSPAGKEKFVTDTVQIRDQIIKHDAYQSDGYEYDTPPSEYLKDKLNGMALVLTRKNRNGKVVTREFKDGRPPKPKDRFEYR